MRRFILIAAIVAACAASPQAGEAGGPLRPGDHVLVLGDSITALAINPRLIGDYLLMCKPAADLSVTMDARGGETATGCSKYVATDLRLKPDVVTTLFGFNDGGYSPMTPEKALAYREGLTTIIAEAKKAGVRLIVIGSTTCLDPYFGYGLNKEKTAMYNGVLAQLRDIAQDVARKEGVVFAEVHDLMLGVLAKCKAKYGEDKYCFSESAEYDGGCHVSESGQLVIAYALLKAMGCDGDIGTITVDLAAGKAKATEGHEVLSMANGQVEIESTRYPFCFYGADPSKATSTRGVIEFLPFNEDLNRFRLVIKNLGAQKAKVTWGAASKEFPAARLEQGINLAAEFLDNPFSGPFARVDNQIKGQQGLAGLIIGALLHPLPLYEQYLPEEKELTEQIFTAIADKCKQSADAATAAVEPVRHTIKIEAMK